MTVMIALGAAIAPQVNTLLDSERNLPRAGDRLTLTELTGSIHDTDSTRTLDLSAEKCRKEVNRRYAVTDDTLLMELTDSEVKIYNTDDGSLTLLEERKPGQRIRAVNPERTLALPAAAGAGESGHFITFGRLGTLGEIQESGRTESRVSERSHTLITPEGDTLRNVTHRQYRKTGAMSAWLAPPLHPTVNDTLMVHADSIERFLETDTIIHRRTVDSWYLDGYRYPIAEQTVDQIYYQESLTESRHRTLYYSPFIQEYEITDDPHNQAIRDKRRMNDFATILSHGDNRTVPGANDDTGHHDTAGNSGFNSTAYAEDPTVEVWPTIVDEKTTVILRLPTPAKVTVKLSNRAGAEMWTETREMTPGAHSIDCPTTQLTAGPYILSVNVGGTVHTRILIKR